MDCKLKDMFELRKAFINAISEMRPGSYPKLPIDISKKESQQFCRDLALRGVEEMFEALQHLKNWKQHRLTDVEDEFESEEFLEEIVDAMNYFFALLIVTGFDENDLYSAYLKKDEKIHRRLIDGY